MTSHTRHTQNAHNPTWRKTVLLFSFEWLATIPIWIKSERTSKNKQHTRIYLKPDQSIVSRHGTIGKQKVKTIQLKLIRRWQQQPTKTLMNTEIWGGPVTPNKLIARAPDAPTEEEEEEAAEPKATGGHRKEAPRAYLCEGRRQEYLSSIIILSLSFYELSYTFSRVCLRGKFEHPAPKKLFFFLLFLNFVWGSHLLLLTRQVCDFPFFLMNIFRLNTPWSTFLERDNENSIKFDFSFPQKILLFNPDDGGWNKFDLGGRMSTFFSYLFTCGGARPM